jgi:hypothetical protein
MAITISTDHFLLDDQGLSITAFGYEVSCLNSCVTKADGSYTFERELLIERLDTKRTWHWTAKHGRITSTIDGEIRDGWVKG